MMERTSQNLGAAGAAIASGGNPFFRSLNQSYGEPWKCSGGVNPQHLQETPEYRDLVSATSGILFSCNTFICYIMFLTFFRIG